MYFQILLGFVLLAATAAAQSTAMLTGTVNDSSGAIIVSASVECRNTETDMLTILGVPDC